jgi:hypothetical protein
MKLFFLLFALIPVARAEDKPPVFPETCKQDCVSLFGEKLGATNHGIESFSNCKPTCVYAKPEFVNKEYAGIEWQCVEFARRWLMREKGFTFPSVDVAADLWNKVKHLESVATKAVRPLEKHSNGEKEAAVSRRTKFFEQTLEGRLRASRSLLETRRSLLGARPLFARLDELLAVHEPEEFG